MSIKRESSMKPFVLMALNTNEGAATEAEFLTFWLSHRGYGESGIKQLHGVWEGDTELSWLITLPMNLDERRAMVADLQHLAEAFEQDAILYSDTRRNSYLMWMDTDRAGEQLEALGTFTNVSEQRAREHDCYTFDPQRNTYWITEAPSSREAYAFCDVA